jgi:hypothetical protein
VHECRTERSHSQPSIGGIRVLRTDRSNPIDLHVQRSVGQIVQSALAVYGHYPVLFALLAVAVVAPYDLLVLVVTGSAPLGKQSTSVSTTLTLSLLDFALIGPLVSALHIHAVVAIGEGEQPKLLSVAWRGLRVLPVVAAAQIIAGLGIGIGLFAFIVPGIFLLIRWAVVAQVAAIEHTDWLGALRRSGELTRGNYLHVLGLIAVTAVVSLALRQGGQAIAETSAQAPQVLLGIVLDTLARAFAALTTAILFFDLLARKRAQAVTGS